MISSLWRYLLPMQILVGCTELAPQKANAASWALKCQGIGNVQVENAGIKRPSVTERVTTTIYYRWESKTRTLITEHQGAEPTAFCRDSSQERCQVTVVAGQLSATNFDLMQGKQQDALISFGEEVEIDLNALTGVAKMINSTGTIKDRGPVINFKAVASTPLRCEWIS